jgi:hypothetical protein
MEMVAEIDRVEGLSGGELLDHVEALAATQRRCEVGILVAAVQHAYLHDAESVSPAGRAGRAGVGRPGRERARVLGGVGTPEVAEFAAAELGGRLEMSTMSAAMLMADGLDLAHRLPLVWARVRAGEARVYLARLVARKTRPLTAAQAAWVDRRVVEYVDGRLTWTRFQGLVEGLVAAADPAGTAEAERQAATRQVARPTHTQDPDQPGRGLRGFYIRAPFATIAVFDAAVARIAEILADLGDPDPLETRRVTALLVLSRPDLAHQLLTSYRNWWTRRHRTQDPQDPSDAGDKPQVDWATLLPRVVVYLHTYTGPHSEPGSTGGIARVEDCGPMSLAWVRDHLSPHAKVTIRPVLDIEGLAPVDAYEIPQRHRRAVRLMTPADTFPYSSSLHPTQIDHTIPYRHPDPQGPGAVGAGQSGQSGLGNYGPLSTTHHRLKTFGRWQVQQPFPGIYLWRDPHGATYLVDHTGTRRLHPHHAA